MCVSDYIAPQAPSEFQIANAALERRDQSVLADIGTSYLPVLLRMKMAAVSDAPPEKGKFPLIIYSAGINPTTLSNAVLAEFLATHGYVVVAVTSLGQSSETPDQDYSPLEMETDVHDLEFAAAFIRTRSYLDGARVGVVGHSLGGTIAMMFAMRNTNVSAVVGLDGTYGFAFQGNSPGGIRTLTEWPQYAPQSLRARVLDIYLSDYATLDLSAVRALEHADRYLVTFPRMLHLDFVSYVEIRNLLKFPLPRYVSSDSGYTNEIGAEGFERVCRVVCDFLDAVLKGDTTRTAEFESKILTVPDATIAKPSSQP